MKKFFGKQDKAVIISSLVCIIAICGFGKVFIEKQFLKGGGEKALRALSNWQSIYKSTGKVNGVNAEIEIFGVNEAFVDAIKQIRGAFNDESGLSLKNTEGMWQGFYEEGNKLIRYLVLRFSGAQGTVVFSVKHKKEEVSVFGKMHSAFPAIARSLGMLPYYKIELEQRNVVIEFYKVPFLSQGLSEKLLSAMEQEGWHKCNEFGRRTGGNFMAFSKAPFKDICFIFISEYSIGSNERLIVAFSSGG